MFEHEEVQELFDLTNALRYAVEDELRLRRRVADLEAELDATTAEVLASYYADGTIDGRNADIRKQQEMQVVASSEAIQQARANLRDAEKRLDVTSAIRQQAEAEVSLIRAWLYSQGGVR